MQWNRTAQDCMLKRNEWNVFDQVGKKRDSTATTQKQHVHSSSLFLSMHCKYRSKFDGRFLISNHSNSVSRKAIASDFIFITLWVFKLYIYCSECRGSDEKKMSDETRRARNIQQNTIRIVLHLEFGRSCAFTTKPKSLTGAIKLIGISSFYFDFSSQSYLKIAWNFQCNRHMVSFGLDALVFFSFGHFLVKILYHSSVSLTLPLCKCISVSSLVFALMHFFRPEWNS